MAQFLFIEDFASQTEKHRAGDVVDDDTHDLTLLRTQGAALIEYVPIVHDPLVRQFRVQRRREPGLQLFPILAGAGFAGVVPSVTTAPLDLYVSDINGDDSNNGLSPGAPLKTFDRIDELVPDSVRHLTKVHTGRHDGAGYALPSVFRERLLNNRLYFVGDGAGQPGEDGFITLLAGTAGGGSTANKLVTSGLTPNAFRRRTVLILDGAAAGDRRSIKTHDATDVIPATPFSASVAGASFRIVQSDIRVNLAARPEGSVVFCSDDFRAASGLAGLKNLPRVGFVNLAFEGFGVVETIGASVWYGCDFDLDALAFPLFAGPVLAGMDTSEILIVSAAATVSEDFPTEAPGDLSWAGWGITGKGDAFLGSLLMVGVPFSGFLVVPGFFGGGEPFSQIIGGSLFGGPGSALTASLLTAEGVVFVGEVGGAIPVEIRNDAGPAVTSGLFAGFSSSVADLVLRNVDLIAGGVGDGVVVGGRASVRHNGGTVTAGRYGYNAVRGGRMDFDNAVTITATTADTTVNDGSAVKAQATYVAVGDALLDTPNDGSIVQRLA